MQPAAASAAAVSAAARHVLLRARSHLAAAPAAAPLLRMLPRPALVPVPLPVGAPALRLPSAERQQHERERSDDDGPTSRDAYGGDGLLCMNRNAREPRKSNHGARPCSSVRRRRKIWRRANPHPFIPLHRTRKPKGYDI